MHEEHKKRLHDFEERASHSSNNEVYTHPTRGWRYVPVHWFAGELEGNAARWADCWVSLNGDIALLECGTNTFRQLAPGLYFHIDQYPPHFPKLHAIFREAEVTREMAEAAMARFSDLGFPNGSLFDLPPGGSLVRVGDH